MKTGTGRTQLTVTMDLAIRYAAGLRVSKRNDSELTAQEGDRSFQIDIANALQRPKLHLSSVVSKWHVSIQHFLSVSAPLYLALEY